MFKHVLWGHDVEVTAKTNKGHEYMSIASMDDIKVGEPPTLDVEVGQAEVTDIVTEILLVCSCGEKNRLPTYSEVAEGNVIHVERDIELE